MGAAGPQRLLVQNWDSPIVQCLGVGVVVLDVDLLDVDQPSAKHERSHLDRRERSAYRDSGCRRWIERACIRTGARIRCGRWVR